MLVCIKRWRNSQMMAERKQEKRTGRMIARLRRDDFLHPSPVHKAFVNSDVVKRPPIKRVKTPTPVREKSLDDEELLFERLSKQISKQSFLIERRRKKKQTDVR